MGIKNKMDLHKKFAFAIVLFLVLLFGGTLIYSSIEGWRYIDSVYFTVATVTTIGYGDIVPQTDIGKIFTIFFSFFGIAMFFYFISLITGFAVKFSYKRRVGNLRKEIKEEERLKEIEAHKKHVRR